MGEKNIPTIYPFFLKKHPKYICDMLITAKNVSITNLEDRLEMAGWFSGLKGGDGGDGGDGGNGGDGKNGENGENGGNGQDGKDG